MNTKPGRIAWIILAVALLAALGGIVLVLRDRPDIRPVTAEEERKAAEIVLSERFEGTRYFQPTASDESGKPDLWIDPSEALKQVPGIASARKLDADKTRRLSALVDRMTEAHPFRSVGGGRVKLNRLNLALDSGE